jgi:hypothetical protein
MTADEFRALQTGDPIEHEGRTLRFVRFRGGKATCVHDDTNERVNLFPDDAPQPAPIQTPPASQSDAGASTEQE